MGKLFDKQTEYTKSGLSRFHTPGHSGKAAAIPAFSEVLPYDVTEVEDFDSLYHADGVLHELESRLAAQFGAKATLISSGGCTLAIQTMLALAVPPGGKVLMGRNAHRSALNGAALLDLTPVWLYPAAGSVVTPADVEMGIRENPDVSAVYLTSPNYYGQLCDIKKIAEIAHRHGLPLLIDNAHGSHLGLLKENLHPIRLGADMTACSVHKTLPVPTGGALLNIGNTRFIPRAKEKMALFGSTSPSYLTMAAMDRLVDRMEQGFAKDFHRLETQVDDLRKYAESAGLSLPGGPCDPVRLSISTGANGFTGGAAYAAFRKEACVPEYYDDTAIVFILTPFHEGQDLERLYRGIDRLRPLIGEPLIPPPGVPKNLQKISVREAVFAESAAVAVEEAVGRIAADAVTPCPPGIPVLIPGEWIGEDTVEYLKQRGICTVRVVSRPEAGNDVRSLQNG